MVPHMRQQYLQWLKETNQLGIAGQFSENDGNLQKSIEYYLEAGLPGKAAKASFILDDCMSKDLIPRSLSR